MSNCRTGCVPSLPAVGECTPNRGFTGPTGPTGATGAGPTGPTGTTGPAMAPAHYNAYSDTPQNPGPDSPLVFDTIVDQINVIPVGTDTILFPQAGTYAVTVDVVHGTTVPSGNPPLFAAYLGDDLILQGALPGALGTAESISGTFHIAVAENNTLQIRSQTTDAVAISYARWSIERLGDA